jgi:type IV pili sensor histidine kinase/response regulator
MDVAIRLLKVIGTAGTLALALALPVTPVLARTSSPVKSARTVDSAIPATPISRPASTQAFDPAPYVYTDGGRSVVLGRYSSSSASPPDDLLEPIDAVVSITFPRQTVSTIRQAIDFTLLRSGYRFDDSRLDDAARYFLALPLPESQRQLGPYSLMTILRVLMGSAWQPAVNRQYRSVVIALKQMPASPAYDTHTSDSANGTAPGGGATNAPAPQLAQAPRPAQAPPATAPIHDSTVDGHLSVPVFSDGCVSLSSLEQASTAPVAHKAGAVGDQALADSPSASVKKGLQP